jgi:hypothetical protein
MEKTGVLQNILIQLIHNQQVAVERNVEARPCAMDS